MFADEIIVFVRFYAVWSSGVCYIAGISRYLCTD